MTPPKTLDGAVVVHWAWSEPLPFFVMADGGSGTAIHGLAVCRYDDSGKVYRFSCSREWEVENDSPQDSVEQAMQAPSLQYDTSAVAWHTMASYSSSGVGAAAHRSSDRSVHMTSRSQSPGLILIGWRDTKHGFWITKEAQLHALTQETIACKHIAHRSHLFAEIVDAFKLKVPDVEQNEHYRLDSGVKPLPNSTAQICYEAHLPCPATTLTTGKHEANQATVSSSSDGGIRSTGTGSPKKHSTMLSHRRRSRAST